MNIKTIEALTMICAVGVMSSGCATLVSGRSQFITVESNPPGAMVRVGHQTGMTPVTFKIPKGKDFPIEVSHYSEKRIIHLQRRIDHKTFFNAIPPLWPGFVIDAATGSMMKYDPDVIMVDFTENHFPAARLTRYRW